MAGFNDESAKDAIAIGQFTETVITWLAGSSRAGSI
jgi:hypothetical protein